MKFNDTTGLNGLVQACESYTGLGKAQISGVAARLAEFTRYINANYDKVVTMILQSQDEWNYDDSNHTDLPILTANLVASQQDYALPAALKVSRGEITFDGTEWKRLTPIDKNQISSATDTTSIANDFDQSQPYYDLTAQSLMLYPIPDANVTAGLKLWITRNVDAFTTADTTQEPGIDRAFHDMIAIGAARDWGLSKGKQNTNQLSQMFTDFEKRIRQHYGTKQKDRIYRFDGAIADYN